MTSLKQALNYRHFSQSGTFHSAEVAFFAANIYKYNIFTKEVSAEELEFTFNCQTSKLAEILRPRINRKLAVFLDTLDKGDIIINDWQSFVEKYKLFYSSDTSTQKHIMGRDLASALYKSGIVDSSKKDKYAELRSGVGEYIKQLKEM